MAQEAGKSARVTNNPQTKLQLTLLLYIEKKGRTNTGIQENFGETSTPPAHRVGADAARSFVDDTTGVGGTGVRPRQCRSRSGSRGSSVGYTETGMVEKLHSDIMKQGW